MATKRARPDTGDFTISQADFQHLCSVMDELSFRGPKEESLVMRIAKAGGITEVMKTIKRRKDYAKRMRIGAAAADAGDRAPRPGPRRTPRRSNPRRRRSDRSLDNPSHRSAGAAHEAGQGSGEAA